MNPYADYAMAVERLRELEQQVAGRTDGESRVLALVSALADRLRAVRP